MEQHLTIKKLALALGLCLWSSLSWAQCTGVFPANTLCGNLTGAARPPGAFTASGTIVGPGSSTQAGLPIWANTLGTQLTDAATSASSIAGNYTWAGTQTYSALNTFNSATAISVNGVSVFASSISAQNQFIETGTTAPASANGQTVILGTPGAGIILSATAQAFLYNQSNNGAVLQGDGSVNDVVLFNKTGNSVCQISTGGITFNCNALTLNNQLTVPNGGTGVTTLGAHGILVGEGTSGIVSTAVGATGQAFYSNGTGVDPSFADGAWQLLSTSTVTGSSAIALSNTSSISAAYNEYEYVCENLVPTTNAVSALIQFQVGGVFQTTGYVGNATYGNGGGGTTSSAQISSAGIGASGSGTVVNTGGNIGLFFRGILSNLNATTANQPKTIHGTFINIDTTVPLGGTFGGWWATAPASAISGIQTVMSTGNVQAGTCKIYGRRN